MEKRQFGKTDMQVSVLGFGGSEIGYEEADQATVERLLGSALDAGLNVIDTAECYRDSEELIGKTVGHRRADFYLFTKCGHPHGAESSANWSPDSLLESIARSLRRLQTDCVDLVHLHSCPEAVLKKGDAIAALQTAREKVTRVTSVTAATVTRRATRRNAARSIRCRFRSTSRIRKRSSYRCRPRAKIRWA